MKECKFGVYKIVNKIDGKVYVGESLDIERRWKEHIEDLNNNNHHSWKLQNAWNKYGSDSFEFIRDTDEYKLSIKNDFKKKIYCVYLEWKCMEYYNSIEKGYNVENTMDLIMKGDKGIYGNDNRKAIRIQKKLIEQLVHNKGTFDSNKEPKVKIYITKFTKELPDLIEKEFENKEFATLYNIDFIISHFNKNNLKGCLLNNDIINKKDGNFTILQEYGVSNPCKLADIQVNKQLLYLIYDEMKKDSKLILKYVKVKNK